MDMLEQDFLPADAAKARLLAMTRDQYVVHEGIAYHLAGDKTLRLVPPTAYRRKLYLEVHEWKFGAHLSDV